jgi:hypothetical protein
VLGWPKRCELAHAFLREYSYEKLKLVQLLGQRVFSHGVFSHSGRCLRRGLNPEWRGSAGGMHLDRRNVAGIPDDYVQGFVNLRPVTQSTGWNRHGRCSHLHAALVILYGSSRMGYRGAHENGSAAHWLRRELRRRRLAPPPRLHRGAPHSVERGDQSAKYAKLAFSTTKQPHRAC